ncbi:HD domain-containing protein, partial [Escherichia coli]|nr:HD domain-containing protein [Escherichia coli]
DIIASLDETTRDGYLALHDEYEERVSLESRLVKAADVIDLLAQALAFERAGSRGLDEFWTAVARNLALDEEVAAIVDEVLREMVR